MTAAVLGIDPGTRKMGYALLAADGTAIAQGVVAAADLEQTLSALAPPGSGVVVALGHGTQAAPVRARLAGLGLTVALVDERETTLQARGLYFADHPPRGWRRIVPLGLQVPPRPVDDYAAILIGRRYLAERRAAFPGTS